MAMTTATACGSGGEIDMDSAAISDGNCHRKIEIINKQQSLWVTAGAFAAMSASVQCAVTANATAVYITI